MRPEPLRGLRARSPATAVFDPDRGQDQTIFSDSTAATSPRYGTNIVTNGDEWFWGDGDEGWQMF